MWFFILHRSLIKHEFMVNMFYVYFKMDSLKLVSLYISNLCSVTDISVIDLGELV